MPLHDNRRAFALALPPRGSLLGLDLSKRRIGVAGTDAERRLVTPLLTLKRKGFDDDLRRIAAIGVERSAVGLVLGLPLNMDGSEGPMAKGMREEAARIEAAFPVPLLLQDERLTTEAVKQAILEGRVRRPRPGEATDHLAAAVILEDALRGMG
ncbi:MAG: Holliday junction resolvase RuvX [Geminicoccaceae bacterium]|nr:Holliday junction resolvase RuvX [Geminicoccaceae bacterium]